MEKTVKEVCTIQIMFPVASDEEAIDYKKKIQEALKGNENAQVRFSLTDMPVKTNAV